MTTSELEAFARAEAETGYAPMTLGSGWSIPSPAQAWRDGAVWGFLRAVELLQSEAAVEAIQNCVYDDYREGDKPVIRAALAAAVAAIPETQNTDTNPTTGGYDAD